MANYCFNELRINGDIQQVNRLHKEISSLKDHDDILFCLTGVRYEDHVVFKEDLIYTLSEQDDLICVFNTQWSPVRDFVDDLCRLYKVSCFYHYSEPNMDFAGCIIYQDGEFVDSEEYTESEYSYIHHKEVLMFEIVEMISDEEKLDINEYKERYPFISEEDWNEIEFRYNTKKYNL